jgi:hypothetical protein
MHTVDLLDQALALADSLGYRVRQEWLGGSGGGGCEIRGQKWLFLDLALTPVEQFSQVLDALRGDPRLQSAPEPVTAAAKQADPPTISEVATIPISHELRRALALRKSA